MIVDNWFTGLGMEFFINHCGKGGFCSTPCWFLVQMWFMNGSRDRMQSAINWQECKTFNWYSLLILKFFWFNFGC